MKPTFSNASGSFIRRNPHLFSEPALAREADEAIRRDPSLAFKLLPKPTAAEALSGVMLRQSSKKPNKTEILFEEHLKRLSYSGIHRQTITFEIANGCRYTPDFFVEPNEFYEVKGFMRDDAAVKIKVAARLFPCFKWRLVWRKKGEWVTQEILP